MNIQLREHLPNKFITKLIYIWFKIRGVSLKKNVIIYFGAKLLRYPKKISLKKNVIVKSGAHICPCNKDSSIIIGENTTIGHFTFIYASERIEIGKDCMIASFVYLIDSSHGTNKNSTMNSQSNSTSPILIEDDVWIGANSTILPGVKIGKGSIIAAGSVVNSDVEEYSFYAGVPAKFIKTRK